MEAQSALSLVRVAAVAAVQLVLVVLVWEEVEVEETVVVAAM